MITRDGEGAVRMSDMRGIVPGAAPDAWCADVTDGAAEDTAAEASAAEDSAAEHGVTENGGAERGLKDAARRPGRPRSERAEHAILVAAVEAVTEHGIDALSCEAVAARAGVGKATLYRRWSGKEDLLIAAFAALRPPLPVLAGESVRADLCLLLAALAAEVADPRYAQHFAVLHGAELRYPRLVARYKEQVIEPRRELIRSVLRRGAANGELRADTDVEVAAMLLIGSVLARGSHDPQPGPEDPGQEQGQESGAAAFADRAVAELLRGLEPR